MPRLQGFVNIAVLLTAAALFAAPFDQAAISRRPVEFEVVPDGVVLNFDAGDLSQIQVEWGGLQFDAFSLDGEGTTYDYNRPVLPMVSRFVVVPADAGLEFEYSVESSRAIRAVHPPALCRDEQILNGSRPPEYDDQLYPATPAEMSEPFVFRGVRLVKVTTYPVQYDPRTGAYIHNTNIRTNIRFTDDPPVNPALVPVRRNRSREFLKIIRRMAVNGDEVGRDDPDRDALPEFLGHYLVVTHESCLQYAAQWIEFRRKVGYKVDILSLNANDAGNPATVKSRIQARYNSYLEDGEDPFDMVLLIGDISRYDNLGQNGQWILQTERGWTIWGGGANHADFLFACLEGGQNDYHPDVGIARWASGSADQMGLAVGRTMAYEATPRMQNPEWFGRAGVYSQHWGNGEQSAWHVSIHTNVRWAEEVLKHLGFTDVRFYERYQWDRLGDVVGPWVRDLFNAGVNLLLGRAENYYWRSNFQGVNVNTVFPIRVVLSGHGEWSAWSMWRAHPDGAANRLKGPVATTFGWGGPATAPNSAIWMEMVHGITQMDIPLGWSYTMALNMVEVYFPNFNWLGQQLYLYSKTDVNCYGDPGIKPWLSVPQVVQADFPEEILPSTRQISAYVYDADDENAVAGALVTFYAPGDNPDFNERDDSYKLMAWTNDEGWVQFVIPEDRPVPGPRAYLTVSGRTIRPLQGEITVRNRLSQIELAEYLLDEVEGNHDGIVNPGERFELHLTARNMDDRNAMADVTALVSTSSPWIEITNEAASFGNIAAGQEVQSEDVIAFRVLPSCPDGVSRPHTRPVINIEFASGNRQFASAIQLEPHSPSFQFVRIIGGDQIPPDRRSLDIEIANVGSLNSSRATATLLTQGLGVSVVVPDAEYPAIASGRTSRVLDDRFLVAGNRIAVPGSRHRMMLIVQTINDFVDTVFFDVQVGEPRANSPQGPDPYGYICFDDTDTEWDMAPRYEWVEINPNDNNAEYEGISCRFTGQSEHNIGENIVVPLGFATQFYGHIYDRITICSNGFVVLGNQPRITNFQNWPLDHAIGGGAGMIAPFWDWLMLQQNNSQVYYYHDEENGRFIVEWYRLRHRGGGNTDLIFQLILYDREVWITETGDQNILFQYRSIAQYRGQIDGGVEREKNNPYASVGISSPDGNAGMTYTWLNEYPITSAPLENRRAILFATSPRYRAGTLFGRVTDAETDQPIEGVRVLTEHGFTSNTDADGRWLIADALAEVPFNITFSRQGYNDSTLTDLFLEEDDSLEINAALLHPEFTFSTNSVRGELEPDESTQIGLTLQNDGNGPLMWSVERQLRGEANADPWQLRSRRFVGQLLNDNRVEGVAFADDHFFVAAANGGQPRIFVLNRDGGVERSFAQPAEDNRGMRDLAYDGELLWGAIRNTIYGMTPDGEVVTEFAGGQLNPVTTLAYDPDLDVLWFSSTTSDILAATRDGELRGDLTLNRLDMRLYGLAYWPEDPDGYNLYVFHRHRDNLLETVHKLNTRTGDSLLVRQLQPEGGGSPGGAFITNELDVYSWVFLGLSNASPDNGGDRIDIYQLDARRDWFRIVPSTGVTDAGRATEFTLTLNAADLPPVRFEGDIIWYHNADSGRFVLPVILDVLGGRRNLELGLYEGWNLISANVAPDERDIRRLFAPLTDAGVLQLVKDQQGRFFRPDINFNNIPEWGVSQAYLVAVSEAAVLPISGVIIPSDQPIDLREGWNYAAYFPRVPMSAPDAFVSLDGHLLIAKDGSGRFYLPEFGFSNMGMLSEGQGYQLKLSQEAQLVYRVADGVAALNFEPPPVHFTAPKGSYHNMSILLLGDENHSGWEAAALGPNGDIFGAGRFDASGRCGLAVWGDDPATLPIEGLAANSTLRFIVWDGTREMAAVHQPLRGEPLWSADGLYVGRLTGTFGEPPARFGIQNAHPNPANGPMQFVYRLTEGGAVKLAAYDLTGRLVSLIDTGTRPAGTYRAVWNTAPTPSGVYIIRLEAQGRTQSVKAAVVK